MRRVGKAVCEASEVQEGLLNETIATGGDKTGSLESSEYTEETSSVMRS